MDEDTQEQGHNSVDHLKPWQFKKGQSGNPGGRPKGRSLKAFAREMLEEMTDEERQEFFAGIEKIKIWEMAEGKPDTKTELEATVNVLPITGMKIVKEEMDISE